MTQTEALRLALEALEKVTKQMLAIRDELAERGGRPTNNFVHEELWDSSFDVYINCAIPTAEAIKFALEAKDEPVAWDGYNLDDMCEAFNRVIEEHFHRKHPFHDPVNNDAMIALRTLRGFIPYMKRHTTSPQRKPLTDEEITLIIADCASSHQHTDIHLARAIEQAHGITGENK